MKVAYVDSSCIVALAFREPAATALRRKLKRYDTLVSAALLEAEVSAALRREELEVSDAHWAAVRLIHPDRSLAPEIARMLEAGYVRGADCWHIAAALWLSPDPSQLAFLTLDTAQRSVAARVGFPTG